MFAPLVAKRFGGITDCIELALPEGTSDDAVRELLGELRAIATPCAAVKTSWDEVPAGEVDTAREKDTPLPCHPAPREPRPWGPPPRSLR